MTKIINLTQHQASVEQTKAGVFNLPEDSILKDALTFNTLPTKVDIERRAQLITGIALTHEATHAMIGGAPYLMGALERLLKEAGIQPLYSFTERVSVEKKGENGEIIKTSVFQHKGWVEV